MLIWLEEQSSTNQLTWLAPRLFLTSILDIPPPETVEAQFVQDFLAFYGQANGSHTIVTDNPANA